MICSPPVRESARRRLVFAVLGLNPHQIQRFHQHVRDFADVLGASLDDGAMCAKLAQRAIDRADAVLWNPRFCRVVPGLRPGRTVHHVHGLSSALAVAATYRGGAA